MRNNGSPLERWTVEKSAELYGIRNWGAGCFTVSPQGEVVVTPRPDQPKAAFSLMDVVAGLKARGMAMPVLLRLTDLLDSRIRLVNETFLQTMRDLGYGGTYRGVYPIKVNQQEQVVEEIVRYGRPYHHGLEAGSKAELIAALSFMRDPDAYVICNGYKDEEFIDLGLYALKMGIRCVLVLEMPSELPLILQRAEALGVEPLLGIRIKLASQVGGHWTESGGDRSVFGMTTAELVDAVDLLKARGKLASLKLLHYHLGSQIPNIRDIRSGVTEACRIYQGLVKEGAPMGALDLGGGLAVDYDGSHTNFNSSSNYDVHEYCSDIIEVVMSVLGEDGIPHPTLITESGRAIVAYHSILLFNVLDTSRMDPGALPEALPADTHEYTRNLWEVRQSLSAKNAQECYHDALYYRDEVRQLFTHGNASLRERALAEKIFWNVALQVSRLIEDQKYVPDDFKDLENVLSDVYYGNFSIFQSLPDIWAIDQLFPIMPIHRLAEAPTRNAILSDITCDCDGKIDKFIDLHDIKKTLPLHELREGGDYYLGVFLVGAYQETLGDLHNLLGDTNVMSLKVSGDGVVEYERQLDGDSVADVLSYVEYDTKAMVVRMREMAEKALKEGRLTVEERRAIMDAYEAGLQGYTYFEQ